MKVITVHSDPIQYIFALDAESPEAVIASFGFSTENGYGYLHCDSDNEFFELYPEVDLDNVFMSKLYGDWAIGEQCEEMFEFGWYGDLI